MRASFGATPRSASAPITRSKTWPGIESFTAREARGIMQLDAGAAAEGVDEPGVLGQAVAADAVGRVEDVDVVLALLERVGAADHLHDVDRPGHGVDQLGELVGQRDVEVDPEVVGELDHLGRLGRGDGHHLDGQRLAPEGGGGLAGLGVDAADEDRDLAKLADRRPLGQPLGAEGHVHAGPGGEGGGDDLLVHGAGGAGGHGALDHHDLAVVEMGRDAGAGGADMREIGGVVVRERRADGDEDGAGALGGGRVGRGGEPAGGDALAPRGRRGRARGSGSGRPGPRRSSARWCRCRRRRSRAPPGRRR